MTRRRFLSLLAAVPVVGPLVLAVQDRRRKAYAKWLGDQWRQSQTRDWQSILNNSFSARGYELDLSHEPGYIQFTRSIQIDASMMTPEFEQVANSMGCEVVYDADLNAICWSPKS